MIKITVVIDGDDDDDYDDSVINSSRYAPWKTNYC